MTFWKYEFVIYYTYFCENEMIIIITLQLRQTRNNDPSITSA